MIYMHIGANIFVTLLKDVGTNMDGCLIQSMSKLHPTIHEQMSFQDYLNVNQFNLPVQRKLNLSMFENLIGTDAKMLHNRFCQNPFSRS